MQNEKISFPGSIQLLLQTFPEWSEGKTLLHESSIYYIYSRFAHFIMQEIVDRQRVHEYTKVALIFDTLLEYGEIDVRSASVDCIQCLGGLGQRHLPQSKIFFQSLSEDTLSWIRGYYDPSALTLLGIHS